jgi:hypothetical protein
MPPKPLRQPARGTGRKYLGKGMFHSKTPEGWIPDNKNKMRAVNRFASAK